MAEALRCHSCGVEMVRDVRPNTMSYEGRSVTIEQPGWYHSKETTTCNEVVFNGLDAWIAEAAFLSLKGAK